MKRIIIILILLAIPAFIGLGAWTNAKKGLKSYVSKTLTSYGFENAHINEPIFRDGQVVFSLIQLDKDSFSTLDYMRFAMSYPDIITNKRPNELHLGGLKLSSEFDLDNGLDVSGWTQLPMPLPNADKIILKDAQLDLYNERAGALRFKANGQLLKQEDKLYKIKASIGGEQHQLALKTYWDGTLSADGRWFYEIDIQEAKLRFNKIQAARLSGWVTLDKTKTLIPEISGQIDAGQMNIGGLNFGNFHLTLNGPFNRYKLITKANIVDFKNMITTFEIINDVIEGPQINAVIETNSLDDLIKFMHKLRASDIAAGSVTSLLLTPGNLKRIYKEIAPIKYDALEFRVTGTVYDLTGKVVVKQYKDGVEQRNIISLEPTEEEG